MEERDISTIPDGYAVAYDMYGNPYLERVKTPREKRLANLLSIPFWIALPVVIWLLSR